MFAVMLLCNIRCMSASGVAAGGQPVPMANPVPAAAPEVQHGAAHHADAQEPAIAQGELLQVDHWLPADVHRVWELAYRAAEGKPCLQQGRSNACWSPLPFTAMDCCCVTAP